MSPNNSGIVYVYIINIQFWLYCQLDQYELLQHKCATCICCCREQVTSWLLNHAWFSYLLATHWLVIVISLIMVRPAKLNCMALIPQINNYGQYEDIVSSTPNKRDKALTSLYHKLVHIGVIYHTVILLTNEQVVLIIHTKISSIFGTSFRYPAFAS